MTIEHRPITRYVQRGGLGSGEQQPIETCQRDGQNWPCEVARERERADRAEAQRDRLAEALQHVYGAWRVDHDGRKWPIAEAALDPAKEAERE